MSFWEALPILLDELHEVVDPWLISGSVAAALHGIKVSPHDIDVESTARGAHHIGEQLRHYEVSQVVFSGTDKVRSHFGTFVIGHTVIEVMGDLQVKTHEGWSAPFLTSRGLKRVHTPHGPIPVPSCAALADQYERLGFPERARSLRGERVR